VLIAFISPTLAFQQLPLFSPLVQAVSFCFSFQLIIQGLEWQPRALLFPISHHLHFISSLRQNNFLALFLERLLLFWQWLV